LQSHPLNKLRLFALAAICSLALSGCSLLPSNAPIEDLEGTCQILRESMAPLDDIELLEKKLYYDGDSVAMLLGDETRASNKAFIYSTFPFMQDYSIEGLSAGDYDSGPNDFRVMVAEQFLALTPNPLALPEDELSAMEVSAETAYVDVVEPKVLRIMGDDLGEIGCSSLDSASEAEYGTWVYQMYEDVLTAAEESKTHLLGILLCERDGEIDGVACDKVDFDGGSTSISEYCESQQLSITSNDNEPGVSCGTLSFEIFQADQNTGDCMALGYWTDRNGVEQVGAFFGCGFEEGLSYEEVLVVGNPYTYTNTFGTENTVVSFSLN